MLYAIIPAAGIGSRMQSTIPKQYLPLAPEQAEAGATVLLHSIRAVLALPQINLLMLALHAEDRGWPATEVLLSADERRRVRTCIGGAERWQSVLAALDALAQIEDSAAQPEDWVLVHDAVRPCVRHQDIQALLRACLVSGAPADQTAARNDISGALLARPVADTLKRANAAQQVDVTVDRSGLWAACTPQMFRCGQLREALLNAAAARVSITDEASALEFSGFKPLLVPCASDNIKITWPEDLTLAALILQAQRTAESSST